MKGRGKGSSLEKTWSRDEEGEVRRGKGFILSDILVCIILREKKNKDKK